MSEDEAERGCLLLMAFTAITLFIIWLMDMAQTYGDQLQEIVR